MDDRELEARLQNFGLSEKEAATYLTILRQGGAKASTIAEDAGVSKRYVYSISEELEERGFVEVKDHVVPTVIEAKQPDEVLAGLTERLDVLGPALNERYTTTSEELEQFEVVKSRVTVEKRLAQLVGEADEEIALSLPGDMLGQVRDELAAAVDRGVLVLLILTGTESSEIDSVDVFEGVASVARVWRERVPMILTVDTTYGLVAPVEMLARSNSDMRAISLAQPQLAPVLSGSFLGNYWPMADQAYAEGPADLPGTFRAFRHAVLQSELHLRKEIDLSAAVEARPVFEDGDFRTLEGEVASVRQSIVAPANNSFPVENTIVLRTDDESVTIGGPGAFVEDYEAREVVLGNR
jgi:sugar-specific transcriptional regulator TrmB